MIDLRARVVADAFADSSRAACRFVELQQAVARELTMLRHDIFDRFAHPLWLLDEAIAASDLAKVSEAAHVLRDMHQKLRADYADKYEIARRANEELGVLVDALRASLNGRARVAAMELAQEDISARRAMTGVDPNDREGLLAALNLHFPNGITLEFPPLPALST